MQQCLPASQLLLCSLHCKHQPLHHCQEPSPSNINRLPCAPVPCFGQPLSKELAKCAKPDNAHCQLPLFLQLRLQAMFKVEGLGSIQRKHTQLTCVSSQQHQPAGCITGVRSHPDLHLCKGGSGYQQLAAASCGDPQQLVLLLLGVEVVQLLLPLRTAAAGLACISWFARPCTPDSAVGASCVLQPSCRELGPR
jgi:hypothetical protein